jgi:hypothetical protein
MVESSEGPKVVPTIISRTGIEKQVYSPEADPLARYEKFQQDRQPMRDAQ